MHQGSTQEFQYDLNPYDSFMRNHLKHYGYYTGRNESYRSSTTNHGYDSWEQTQGFHLSDPGSDTDYENQALKGDKLDADNQFSQDQKRSTQLTFSYHAGKMVPKLREPRGLYALSKEPGPQQAPRWPADIEVVPEEEQPRHINTLPSQPETFNEPTGYEQMPQPVAEGEGRVVFYHPTSTESYFLRSRVGGSRAGCPNRAVKIKSADDTTLLFESRFESGNLMKAIQVSEFEYELLLRYDLYTNKHTQWFYFRVQNARRGVKYRFTITNFMKPGSLYNNGMRPLMYSEHAALTKKEGWRRCGEDIKYFKNYVRRTDVKGDKSMYSLTWTVTFPYDNDTYYFAHCYPYTYSDLQQYLLNLSNDPIRSKFCKQRILCRSLAGNMVYILTITNPSQTPLDAKTKRAVVVTARVHPGETNSSWMMKGFLDYLTSNSPDAKLLRDNFVFKIVPMLNPDGVIVGNYRCSLAGRDLNRNYKSVLKDSFPSVAHTKSMIKKLCEEREVTAYCDLHGHSRKQNVFIYGCENKKNANKRLKERVFPVIMGRNAADKFNYDHCKFKVQKSKDGTGRVVMWQMGIMNSYTMEATFCGSTLGSRRKTHFTTADFEDMGYHFCDSILDYCDPNEDKCNTIHADLLEKLRQDILRHLERTGTPLPEDGEVDFNEDLMSDVESSTTGSDSSADDGLPVHLLALAPKLTKKKKLKTRKERDKKRNSAEKPKEKEKEKEQEKEKPTSGRLSGHARDSEGEKKPGSSKKDKFRYRHGDRSTLHSAGRERHAHHGRPDGVPVFAQERCDERTLRKSEYLEALTNAYLMSGVLKPASQDVPSLRYSAGSVGLNTTPMAHVDGLCPHHEKALAEQFVANQLADLQFADDKFDWSHHAMDTNKAVEALSQRDTSSPQRHHDFNNHMITMSALHQSQRPLNDYIRNGAQTTHRPHTAKRSVKSPVKSHPSPFDEQLQERISLKKGYSSTTINLKNTCPSATNFTVYDGQDKHGSSRERKERPTSSKTSKTGMERPSSQALLKRISSANTSSSCSPSDPGIESLFPTTDASKLRGQAKNQLLRSNSMASCGRSSSKPMAEHDIDSTSQDNQEGDTSSGTGQPALSKNRETPTKIHRCPTEATPITDLSTYTNHHRTVSSSHHFQKAQNFYGNTAITQEERVKVMSASSVKSKTSKLKRNSSDDAVMGYRTSLLGGGEKKELLDTNLNMNNSLDGELHDGTGDNMIVNTVLQTRGRQEGNNVNPSIPHNSDDHPNGKQPAHRKHRVDNDDDEIVETNGTNVPNGINEREDSNNNGITDSKMESNAKVPKQTYFDNDTVNRPFEKAQKDTGGNSNISGNDNFGGNDIDGSDNDIGGNDTGDNDDYDKEGDGYKSSFKLSLESALFQQQVVKSPRTPRTELNLSGSNYRQYTNLVKAGKNIEIPQTQQQYTRDLSSSRSGVNSSLSQSVLRQRQVEMSPRPVDNMQKYRPGENPPGTLYPRAPPQSTNNNAAKGAQNSPRQTNSRLSKIMISPREFDISENLYPERNISPQSTQRYIQVSRLALQMRSLGGDRSPQYPDLSASGNYGYPSPPGSPGCEGGQTYRIFKQVPEGLDSGVLGQSYGEPYVSPARKRLERPVSGRRSAKGQRSPVLMESNQDVSSEAIRVVEFQGGFSGFTTKPGYLRSYTRKK